MADYSEMVKILGGRSVFALPVRDEESLARAIQLGLHASALRHTAANTDAPLWRILDLVGVSRRTYERRLADGKRLDVSHSDRLVRFVRVYRLAVEAFNGVAEAARWWLFNGEHESGAAALNGMDRLALLDTEPGAAIIEEELRALREWNTKLVATKTRKSTRRNSKTIKGAKQHG